MGLWIGVWVAVQGGPALANPLAEQRSALRRTVCQQQWPQAIQAIGVLISSPLISSSERAQLVEQRRRLEQLVASRAQFGEMPGCTATIAQIQAEAAAQERQARRRGLLPPPPVQATQAFNWELEVAKIRDKASGEAGPSRRAAACDPAYPDLCLPLGAAKLACSKIPFRNFVVRAPDPHGLDQDRDGVGCEVNVDVVKVPAGYNGTLCLTLGTWSGSGRVIVRWDGQYVDETIQGAGRGAQFLQLQPRQGISAELSISGDVPFLADVKPGECNQTPTRVVQAMWISRPLLYGGGGAGEGTVVEASVPRSPRSSLLRSTLWQP